MYVVQTTVLRDELWSMTFIRVGIARLPQKWKTTGFRIVAFTKDDQNNMIYDALIHTPFSQIITVISGADSSTWLFCDHITTVLEH